MKLVYNDREHAYWLNGRRCKGVTTVAKFPDDTYALGQWRDRMIVIGLARSAPLVHRAAAHFDQRDKIQEIAEEALGVAKAHEASGRGTADHRITERVDLGLEWIDTPANRAIAAAWTDALDAAGVDIDPELCERIVVYPDEMIAGRYDRIGRYRTTGRHVIVDVKTGENAIKYPHSTAIQLGLYANAPLQAVNLRRDKNGNEWTDQFEPLPGDLHRDHAIVVYLPPEGHGRCYRIDTAAGWDAARTICFPTIAWRFVDKGDLVQPLGECLVAPTTTPERLAWVRARVQAIVNAGHEAELAGIWNTQQVPIPLTTDTPLSDTQVDILVGWCSGIEALAALPFEPIDPYFAPFTPTVVDTPPPAPTPPPEVDEEAQRWASEAIDLLAGFDPPERAAVIAACGMTGHETMTAALYDRINAVTAQLDLEGAVLFAYDENGPTVIPADDAEHRMITAAGTPAEAKARAQRIAKRSGRLAPRTLTKAAQIPLYAAMVAAGHGADNTTNNNQEQPT